MTIRPPKYILSIVALFAIIFPSTGEAQERERRVGVTVSAFFNTDAEMANAISETVGRALTKTLKVQTIAGKDAQSKLPEAARSETCIGDTDCLMSAGRSLDVDELLMLIVVGSGEELKIEATWASMDTNETALRPAIVVPIALDEMESILASQAATLIPGVEARAGATPTETSTTNLSGQGSSTTASETATDLSATKSDGSGGMSTLGKGLFVGGAVVVTGWLGYGAYRWRQCGNLGVFGSTCDKEGFEEHSGRDLAIDIVGIAGTAALSAALYMYFTADDGENSSARTTLTPSIDSQSLGFALGGQF